MRMSRVLTGGAVIAAAVAAGTAFTNTNTLEAGTFAGFDSEAVSGATVLNTTYNPDAGGENLASIVFRAQGNLTGTASTLQLRTGGAGGTDTGAASTCTPGAHDNTTPPGFTDITCTFGSPPLLTSFDAIALTVVSQ